MSREKDAEDTSWLEFLGNIEKLLEVESNYKQDGIFNEIEAYFSIQRGKKVGKQTLNKYFKEFKDLKKDENLEHLTTRAKVSEVYVSELNEYLTTKYSDKLSKEFKFDDYKYHYIYYYEGSLGLIKPAIICFLDNNGEWGDGVIYYLSKDKNLFKHNSTFNLYRLKPKEDKNPSKFLYYYATTENNQYKDQVNTFTFNINERVVDKRFLFFATSSALSNTMQGKRPSTNFGIVKKAEKGSLKDRIQDAIDPWIANALIGKRLVFDKLESTVFTREQIFLEDRKSDKYNQTINFQYTCCNILKGWYIGIYLRNEIPSPQSADSGGIAFVLMEIIEDGNASIRFLRSSNDDLIVYSGVLHFHTDKYQIIKGDFEAYSPNTYRFSLFLNELDDSNKFGGVFSGFKKHTLPFASPIIFYRDKCNFESLEARVKKYNPGRINKYSIPDFLKAIYGDESEDFLKKIKEDISKISKNFIETPDGCFL